MIYHWAVELYVLAALLCSGQIIIIIIFFFFWVRWLI
jgi:hypothetical protein